MRGSQPMRVISFERRHRTFSDSIVPIVPVLILLLSVHGANADCVTTISQSYANGQFIITGTNSGTCGGSTVHIKAANGALIAPHDCRTSSTCTVTATIGTTCWPGNPQIIYVDGECGRPGDGGWCVGDNTTPAYTELNYGGRVSCSLS